MGSQVNLKDYKMVLENLLKDLKDQDNFKLFPTQYDRIERVISYAVKKEFKTRGYSVAEAYSYLLGSSATAEGINLAYILGWVLQIMLSHWEMMDDYFDDDEGRMGRPTWYYVNSRGPIAINDTILLEHSAMYILRKYFGGLSIFPKLEEYFSSASYEFYLGQNIELQTTSRDDFGINSFSMENYLAFNRFINLKTFFVARYELAMILAEYQEVDESVRKSLNGIALDFVQYANLQDDINDSFGENMKTTLSDKDIKTGKCKWPILKAKELSSPEQWEKLMNSYGSSEETDVEIVKDIYRELEIPTIGKNLVKTIERKIENNVNDIIDQGHEIGRVFLNLLRFFQNSNEY